jgi:hypothetical protein
MAAHREPWRRVAFLLTPGLLRGEHVQHYPAAMRVLAYNFTRVTNIMGVQPLMTVMRA